MFTKSIKSILAVAAVTVVAISCAKNPSDNVLTASIQSQSATAINVTFTPGSDVKSVEYSVSSAINQKYDSILFAVGVAEIKTVPAGDKGFSFKPAQTGEPYSIFLRPVAKNGQKGSVTVLQAVAGPIPFTLSYQSYGSFVFTVGQNIGEYEGLSIMSMAAENPAEMGMSAKDVISMYADYAMLDVIAAGSTKMVELNGEPDRDQLLGIVYWNKDYSYSMDTVFFTTSHKVSGVASSSIETKVENITVDGATLKFIPGANTCGYCYKLYTKADYDDTRAKGQGLGQDPDEYVRELVAAGGSMDYIVKEDVREYLTPATDYVFVCYPYNVNGSEGWGPSQIKSFTTLAE